MKYLAILIFPLILILSYGGCGNSGGGDDDSIDPLNNCFSELSSNPCFDPNLGGAMTEVDDKSAEEVIDELENRDDFIGELEFEKILSTLGRSYFLPPLPSECNWDDSGLVIKTKNDWDRYRENCYLEDSFFEPPDVNFSQNMLVISLDGSVGFGTEILTVLEFESELIVVIEDTVPDSSSSESRGYGSFVAEITRKNIPVSFLRTEDICNSIYNFENVECLSEAMLNRCENTPCSFTGGRIDLSEPNCSVIDCTTISCDEIEVGSFNIDTVSGIITDIELVDDNLFPQAFINVDGIDRAVQCVLVVE